MTKDIHWIDELPIKIIVTTETGTIIQMNTCSAESFSSEGGKKLLGKNVFDCHPGLSHEKIINLYQNQKPNHYTILKNGKRKIIHQIPRFKNGNFSGFVELSIEIPKNLPHFDRDQ